MERRERLPVRLAGCDNAAVSEGERRGGDRIAVGIRVRLGYETVDDLVERFAVNVSRGGFFVRTRDAKPVGTELAFELLLAGGERAIRGHGVVRWVSRPSADARVAPGMGIQFVQLDEASRAIVERMVERREREGLAPGVAGEVPVVPRPATTPPPTRAPTPIIPEVGVPVLARTAKASPALPLPGEGDLPSTPPWPSTFPSGAPAPSEPSHPRDLATGRDERGQSSTSTSTANANANGGDAAQADLSIPHLAPRLEAGPAVLDLGLTAHPQPPAKRSGPIIGIDLGTTNSCAAVVRGGKPYVIPSRDGYNTVPSVVAVNARHKLVVGHQAKAQLLSNPRDTVYGAKRLVGRPFHSRAVQQIREAFAYEIVEGDDGMATVELAGHRLSLEQVSALVLKEVKEVAQNHLGEEVSRAVITVPAYYTERQREAVRTAGALAGLHVERIVNEPTAAALAYAYGRRVKERVLVYDLGGGTFDASVLELQDNVYEVISTGGDAFLGGVDFDNRIVARLLERYEEQVGRPFDGDRVALSRLVDAAERAKCSLSEGHAFRIQLPYLATHEGEPVALDASLTRDEIVALVEPLVDRTIAVCRDALAARGLKPKDVDEVILVGGQSRMPLVHAKVREFFGRSPSRAVHPDEAVAMGAALLAHSLGNSEGLILIDVLPMSIAVVTPTGRLRTVFERNTPLPARKQHSLSTTQDGQTTFELVVVQGDAPTADEREYLGTVRLDGLASGPRGMVKIALSFELELECLLTVTARELETNRTVRASFSMRARPPDAPAKPAATSPPARPPLPAPPAPREAARAGALAAFFQRLLRREKRP
jgi:molecular chaperone DnaK